MVAVRLLAAQVVQASAEQADLATRQGQMDQSIEAVAVVVPVQQIQEASLAVLAALESSSCRFHRLTRQQSAEA